ncbi:MAG: UvrB/UvrC motif-containing protein [Clostridiales bacterium]|nr:UvrB/UvrC motif-containing protein [Clostridiales bacterium]
MICQKCKQREATGYMEKTVGGVKTRVYVCPECFKQAQLEMFSSLDDFGLFSGLTGSATTTRIKCPKCGTSLREISDTCFVGCPYCYTELGEQIKPIIRNIQSAAMHIGSSPESSDSETPSNEISEIEAQLKRAVEAENYEQALKLSERLKALKGGNA